MNLINSCLKTGEWQNNWATTAHLFMIKYVQVMYFLLIKGASMKKIVFFFLIFISQSVFADTLSDSDQLFSWAETQYPEFFSPPSQSSQTFENYYYRYYPDTNNYLGTHTIDLDVHVLGDTFGGQVRVNSLQALMVTAGLATGSCAAVPLISTGTKYTWTTTSQGVSFTSDITHDLVTTTQAKETVISQGSTTTTEKSFTINNDIISSTELITNTSGSGFDLKTETTFSPFMQAIAYNFCVGQTLNSSYESTTKSLAGTSSTDVTEVYGVDAVNESLITAGGTFTTVKFTVLRTDSGGTIRTINWLDQATGILVRQESYDNSGSLNSTTEVTSL